MRILTKKNQQRCFDAYQAKHLAGGQKHTAQKLSYFDCHVQQLTQEWVLEVKEKVAQELAGLLLYKQIKYQHKLK